LRLCSGRTTRVRGGPEPGRPDSSRRPGAGWVVRRGSRRAAGGASGNTVSTFGCTWRKDLEAGRPAANPRDGSRSWNKQQYPFPTCLRPLQGVGDGSPRRGCSFSWNTTSVLGGGEADRPATWVLLGPRRTPPLSPPRSPCGPATNTPNIPRPLREARVRSGRRGSRRCSFSPPMFRHPTPAELPVDAAPGLRNPSALADPPMRSAAARSSADRWTGVTRPGWRSY